MLKYLVYSWEPAKFHCLHHKENRNQTKQNMVLERNTHPKKASIPKYQ